MRVLDLFCGGGGASKGYVDAGFEVVGIDLAEQPFYPYDFIRADVMEMGWVAAADQFDLIHASPPCQRFSPLAARHGKAGRYGDFPDLVTPIREALMAIGRPYVIENLGVAPLENVTTLCGSMFGLDVRRHRRFETNFPVEQPECRHSEQGQVVGVYGNPGGSSTRDNKKYGTVEDWRRAMGINWLSVKGLREAIPPAYTWYLATWYLAMEHPETRVQAGSHA